MEPVIHQIETKSVITKTDVPVCDYAVNPYVGCTHGCKYCYAKSLLEFRGLWHPDNPSVANIDKVEKKIKKLKPGTVLRLGGMTDCFQPAENVHRVTMKTIDLLNKYRIGYLIITKSPMVAKSEYLDRMDRDLAHVQFTLTFTDDELYRKIGIENAPPPSARIKAIETLESAGVDTAIRLSPYIPQFIDNEVLNNIKCDKVLVEFLRMNHWMEKWFGGKLDFSDYTRKFHGYNHLPFEKKMELVKQLGKAHTVTVCDWEPEYLDFWKKEYNPNPKDCCNLRTSDEQG